MRALKEVGWAGFSVNDALAPLINMGQQLFEPPDVAGWELGLDGSRAAAMLARMNFAAQLATNQKFALRDLARRRRHAGALLGFMLDRFTPPRFDRAAARCSTTRAPARHGRARDAQLATKAAGLAHLITGSGDYQLV